jgi:hypothetical protein
MIATAALLLPLKSQGQLGALGNAGGTVTAESLNADLSGGLEFFAKESEGYRSRIDLALKDKKLEEASGIQKEQLKELNDAIDKAVKENKPLTEAQKKLVKEGQAEAAKGVAKWAAVGASLAMAAKSGKSDAQLATAIPAAQQLIKDLPDIKNMISTINKLSKIK